MITMLNHNLYGDSVVEYFIGVHQPTVWAIIYDYSYDRLHVFCVVPASNHFFEHIVVEISY